MVCVNTVAVGVVDGGIAGAYMHGVGTSGEPGRASPEDTPRVAKADGWIFQRHYRRLSTIHAQRHPSSVL
jgi:hypothetical protein